mmetsp:Transcript_14699/g.57720  ORF Transcript_14699/g.57720 Transcript_14699/m.57720 type:complete len:215 (-) Transcript_14699:428-1072(-)
MTRIRPTRRTKPPRFPRRSSPRRSSRVPTGTIGSRTSPRCPRARSPARCTHLDVAPTLHPRGTCTHRTRRASTPKAPSWPRPRAPPSTAPTPDPAARRNRSPPSSATSARSIEARAGARIAPVEGVAVSARPRRDPRRPSPAPSAPRRRPSPRANVTFGTSGARCGCPRRSSQPRRPRRAASAPARGCRCFAPPSVCRYTDPWSRSPRSPRDRG